MHFVDDDLEGGSSGELQDLSNRLIGRATAYEVEVSTEKSKIMTNSTNNIRAEIVMNGQMLEEGTRMAPAQQMSASGWQQWPD